MAFSKDDKLDWPHCHGQPMTLVKRVSAMNADGMQIESCIHECAVCRLRTARPMRYSKVAECACKQKGVAHDQT